MAFVCGKIEEMMLRQNFEVSPQVYLQTSCIGQMEKIVSVCPLIISEVIDKLSLLFEIYITIIYYACQCILQKIKKVSFLYFTKLT